MADELTAGEVGVDFNVDEDGFRTGIEHMIEDLENVGEKSDDLDGILENLQKGLEETQKEFEDLSAAMTDVDEDGFITGVEGVSDSTDDLDQSLQETDDQLAELSDTMDETQNSSDELANSFEETESSSMSLMDGLTSLGGVIAGLVTAAALASITALAAAIGVCTSAAMDAQDADADLQATLKSTGGAAGMTSEELHTLASNLQLVTKFDEEATLSGESMLLTFTNIGKDVFPRATEAMLDYATKMKTDPVNAAMALGKALNSPKDGVNALRRVGVTFTEEQINMINAMQDAGDMAGAQGVILSELEKEFGGVARAAGQTLSGKLVILKNRFGEVQESIGNAFLPVFTTMVGAFDDWMQGEDGGIFIKGITDAFQFLADTLNAIFPTIFSWFEQFMYWLQSVPEFLQANQGIIIGVFVALGVAVTAWAYTMAAAGITAAVGFITPLLPVIAVLLVIAGVVALVYTAWTENWGNIQGETEPLINMLQMMFQNIVMWFQENIPVALAFLQQKWNQFWTEFQFYVMPIVTWFIGVLTQLVFWFMQNVPIALQFLSDIWNQIWTQIWAILEPIWLQVNNAFVQLYWWLYYNLPVAIQAIQEWWNTVFIPILQKVWDFIVQYIFPIFQKLWDLIMVSGQLAFLSLQVQWETVLKPTLDALWDFIVQNILPALKNLWDFIQKYVIPILTKLADYFGGQLIDNLNNLGSVLDGVISTLRTLLSLQSQVGGSGGSGLGGGYANGGPIRADGQIHPVGERGPELFSPGSGGYIIPNDKLQGIGSSSNSDIMNLLSQIANKKEFDAVAMARILRDELVKVM